MRPAAVLALALTTCLLAAPAWADEHDGAREPKVMTPPPTVPAKEADGGDDEGWSRQDYLAWHKHLGLASAIVLTAQLGAGTALLKGLDAGEDVAGPRTAHRILGTSGFLLHA